VTEIIARGENTLQEAATVLEDYYCSPEGIFQVGVKMLLHKDIMIV